MDSQEHPFAHVDASNNPQLLVRFLDTVAANPQIQMVKQQTYRMLDIAPGQMLLDVGCGTGEDVRGMAALVGTTGTVAGVDNSATMVSIARKRSIDCGYPTDFQQADVTQLPFADATFDGVRSERVFQHLKDRRTALAEMLRVTKPGGRVVVNDADAGMTAVTGSDRALTRAVLNFLSDDGQNGWCGRELPGLFHEVGFTQIQVVPDVLQVDTFRAFDELMSVSGGLKYAQKHDLLSAADIATWLADIAAVEARNEFFAAVVVFSVMGQRPI